MQTEQQVCSYRVPQLNKSHHITVTNHPSPQKEMILTREGKLHLIKIHKVIHKYCKVSKRKGTS